MVIALTHIGFTENPASVEVDNNVDTYLATQVAGVDAIIGGHSHTESGNRRSGRTSTCRRSWPGRTTPRC